MSCIGTYKKYEIHYVKNPSNIHTNRDFINFYLFEAMKYGCCFLRSILYEVSSTPKDITEGEIKEIGKKHIINLIDRKNTKFEQIINKNKSLSDTPID